ncbi:MAG: glycosyltransferase [Salibacteraceae bacterium]
MAHIFKYPDSNNKGIIVFTHKEAKFLFSEHEYFREKTSRRELPFLKAIFKKDHSKEKKDFIEEISKNYFLGVHFGWKFSDFPALSPISFYMGSPSTVEFSEPNSVRYIPMDGSSFIPECFYLNKPKKHPKIWDIIMVSRDVKWKNLDKFLLSVRQLYDSGKYYKVMLIVPSNNDISHDSNDNITYTNLLSDYERMFNYQERGFFTILKTHPNMPFLGLAQPQIAKFYHLSKIFALYSEQEGGSRVISEALLSGLPVVVKSTLSGGGKDFLNEKNAVMFDDFETAHVALERAVEQWEVLNNDEQQIINLALEDRSITRLKTYFTEIYASENYEFDGKLINTDWLSFRLNGHWHEGLPWADKKFASPDITTFEQLELFKERLQI